MHAKRAATATIDQCLSGEVQIPIHPPWHVVEVLSQPLYVMSLEFADASKVLQPSSIAS